MPIIFKFADHVLKIVEPENFHQELLIGDAIRNRCRENLNSLPLEELQEITGMPSYYVDEDYPAKLKSNNLSMDEAFDVAQNRPLWRLMSTFGATDC